MYEYINMQKSLIPNPSKMPNKFKCSNGLFQYLDLKIKGTRNEHNNNKLFVMIIGTENSRMHCKQQQRSNKTKHFLSIQFHAPEGESTLKPYLTSNLIETKCMAGLNTNKNEIEISYCMRRLAKS